LESAGVIVLDPLDCAGSFSAVAFCIAG